MTQEVLKAQIQQQKDAVEKAVIAYQAKAISSMLENAQKEETEAKAEIYVQTHFQKILTEMDDGKTFTAEQAAHIAQRYTPVAALHDVGAGAVLLRDKQDGQYIGAVRGTDTKSGRATALDDIGADAGITFGFAPLGQTVKIDNWFARETAPKGMPVSQLRIVGETFPVKLMRDSDAFGTGHANGVLKYVAGHSEGSPEAQMIGARYRSPVFTVNGPGGAHGQMQNYVDTARKLTGMATSPVGKDSVHIDTTKISVISQLWGGLHGEKTTVPTFGTGFASHSSAEALKALDWTENLLNKNPKITDMSQVIQLSRLNETDRTATLEVLNRNPSATLDQSIELVELAKGRGATTMGGYNHGEAAYQNALKLMDTANKKIDATVGKDINDRLIQTADAAVQDKAKAEVEHLKTRYPSTSEYTEQTLSKKVHSATDAMTQGREDNVKRDKEQHYRSSSDFDSTGHDRAIPKEVNPRLRSDASDVLTPTTTLAQNTYRAAPVSDELRDTVAGYNLNAQQLSNLATVVQTNAPSAQYSVLGVELDDNNNLVAWYQNNSFPEAVIDKNFNVAEAANTSVNQSYAMAEERQITQAQEIAQSVAMAGPSIGMGAVAMASDA
ncbi:MAG: hypothetical protein ACRCV6_05930 [Formosimonas sp.]